MLLRLSRHPCSEPLSIGRSVLHDQLQIEWYGQNYRFHHPRPMRQQIRLDGLAPNRQPPQALLPKVMPRLQIKSFSVLTFYPPPKDFSPPQMKWLRHPTRREGAVYVMLQAGRPNLQLVHAAHEPG